MYYVRFQYNVCNVIVTVYNLVLITAVFKSWLTKFPTM